MAHGTQEELSKFEAQTIEAVNEEINKQSEVINEVKELKLSLKKLTIEQDALERGIINRIVDDRSKTLDKIEIYTYLRFYFLTMSKKILRKNPEIELITTQQRSR